MNAIKVDITLTPYDVESNTVRFAIFDDTLPICKVEDLKCPSLPVPHTIETWNRIRIVDNKKKEERFYLVRVDQTNIFQDLLQIHNDTVNLRIQEQIKQKLDQGDFLTKECFFDMLHRVRIDTKREIHNLPWWKRLFNQF